MVHSQIAFYTVEDKGLNNSIYVIT